MTNRTRGARQRGAGCQTARGGGAGCHAARGECARGGWAAGSFRVARLGHFEQKRPFVCGSEPGAEKSIQIMREKVFSKKAFSMYDRLVPSFP